jgi:hypothetical protein
MSRAAAGVANPQAMTAAMTSLRMFCFFLFKLQGLRSEIAMARYALAIAPPARRHFWLPDRKQKLPDDNQPNGHVRFGGFVTASWAPALGVQNEPLAR